VATVSIHPPKTPVTKGSNSISMATLPNICKMPGPPAPFVPTPLPNIGKSSIQPKGYSRTVKIEGNQVAIKGASFGSMGDIASKGTGGGIVSMNCEGLTKFIAPGSITVKIEGGNVHLLSDVMSNNNGPSGSPPNAATLNGTIHAPTIVDELNLTKMACDCMDAKGCKWDDVKNIPVEPGKEFVRCCILGSRREKCVQEKIAKEQEKGKGNKVHSPAGANYQSNKMPNRPSIKGKSPEKQGYCRPDIVVGSGSKPLNASDMEQIIDLKFPCNTDGKLPAHKDWNPSKALGKAQRECYERILLPKESGGDGKPAPKPVKVTAVGPTKEGCAAA
jgi:hypothetical protein